MKQNINKLKYRFIGLQEIYNVNVSFTCNSNTVETKQEAQCARGTAAHGSSTVVDFCSNPRRLWNFLLVINSNLGHIWHRFWDTATYWLKIANFPYPLSCSALSRGDPLRISEKASRIMKLVFRRAEGEDVVITARVVLIESQSVADRQTDRHTNAFAIAKTGLLHSKLCWRRVIKIALCSGVVAMGARGQSPNFSLRENCHLVGKFSSKIQKLERKIPHFWENLLAKIKLFSTHNLLCRKFAAVFRKIATSCPLLSFFINIILLRHGRTQAHNLHN